MGAPPALHAPHFGRAMPTCDPEEVHLITHVDTTPATVHEAMRSEEIHQALTAKGLPRRSIWSMPPT